MRTRQSRKRAELFGRLAEYAAIIFLALKGYGIVAKRYRTPAGEIDIIARRGRLLAFIEVKARRTLGAALDAVTPRARRRIAAAAGFYLSRHQGLADSDMRYDIIAIAPWRVNHVKSAWRENTQW